MAKLSVNLDHIATLREARKSVMPDPVHAAVIAEQSGADGITVHLRQDRRHIKERDLMLIRQVIHIPLTLEMSPTAEMLEIALKVKPDMVTLVPELTTELTTEHGFSLGQDEHNLTLLIDKLHEKEIALCLFIDPTEENIHKADDLKADYVELNTSYYSDADSYEKEKEELKRIEKAANSARSKDMGVNVGHGLNYKNVQNIVAVKAVQEFSIGHSIVARSIFTGFEKAVKEMLELVHI